MNWRIKKYTERNAFGRRIDQDPRPLRRKPSASTEAENTILKANRAEIEALSTKIERRPRSPGTSKSPARPPAPDPPTAVLTVRSPALPPVQYVARARRQRVSPVKAGFENDPKCGFASPRDYIMAVLAHGNQDVRTAEDQRLRFLAAAGSDEQGTYSDPYGGFLVPMGFHPGS